MKTQTNPTQESEFARAAALDAAGEHADAAQVRAWAEQDAARNFSGSYRTPDGKAQIDWRVEDGRFSASGNYDGGAGQCLASIAEAYPDDHSVQRLCAIWDKYHLKPASDTALCVLRVAYESLSNASNSFHDQQAEKFLQDNGLKFRATLSDTKSPQWESGGNHGHHYRITLSRCNPEYQGEKGWTKPPMQQSRLVFDFWSSTADAEARITTVKPYSVLACISGDIYTPETFKDFCAECGYDTDSITALQQFRRCSAFAKRLRAFFTDAEQAQLSEIR